jgi:flagellar hook assembly protein FlgD
VIEYQLPVDAHVVLKVYDLLGRVVATVVDQQKPAGYHRATFDATAVGSGVYFYRMAAGRYNAVRKLLVVK